MPFKVTVLRLETIADIVFILGIIGTIVISVSGSLLGGILCLIPSFLFSYILYAVAKILQNTENIHEYLKDPKFLKNNSKEEADNED